MTNTTSTAAQIAAAELRYADAVAAADSIEHAIRNARRYNKSLLWGLTNELEQARQAVWQAAIAVRAAYAAHAE